MARISNERLEVGRECILSRDMDGFARWMNYERVTIDRHTVYSTIDRCVRAGDTAKALKLFDAAFVGMDPARDRFIAVAAITTLFVLILGALTGFILFMRWVWQ